MQVVICKLCLCFKHAVKTQHIDHERRRALDDVIVEYHLDTAHKNYAFELLFNHLTDDITLLVQQIIEFWFVY